MLLSRTEHISFSTAQLKQNFHFDLKTENKREMNARRQFSIGRNRKHPLHSLVFCDGLNTSHSRWNPHLLSRQMKPQRER
ncbi:hypothetical protein JOB18_014777 [Solea senegalensis]|uniref:Uncharacterized protein n=1 Tax=Solea senegalensis TaxID=28829 RepID=A0AAV6QV96_SOLSE|nr:hypothetical protein JOB18_014777 [Solea senegalensis]